MVQQPLAGTVSPDSVQAAAWINCSRDRPAMLAADQTWLTYGAFISSEKLGSSLGRCLLDIIGNWFYYQVFVWVVMFERETQRLGYDQKVLKN